MANQKEICPHCGKAFKGLKVHMALVGRTLSPEHKQNISKGLSGKLKSPEHSAKVGAVNKAKMTEYFSDPMNRAKQSEARKKAWQKDTPANQRSIDAMRQGWRKKTPTAPEQKIIDLSLEHGLPIKYTGQDRWVIGRHIPDFVHMNEKKVVEVYGDYWHRNDDPQDRIDLMKSYGYDCIIVWEHEINDDLQNVLIRLGEFL